MEFKILGGLVIERDGHTVDLGPPKLSLLLAVLLCRLGEPVPIPELIDAIWNDQPPASASENLRYYVYQLRKALGRTVIERRGAAYCLVADAQAVDARRFAALVAQAEVAMARGEHSAAITLFREGLALWHGRPFAGLHAEPALVKDVLRWEEQRLAALERCYSVQLDVGAHAELVVELTVLAAENPYRERLHGQLMMALYRCGRRAEALKVYRDLRTLFVSELGIEPGRDIDDLHQAVLRADRTLDTAPAADPAAPPAGPLLPA